MSKSMNRRDLARVISQRTGYTITDILEVLTAQEEVYEDAISKGYSIKAGKLYKLELEDKKAKRAWDGINERYYTIEAKQVLKFKPLTKLTKAVDKLNVNGTENDSNDADE